MGKNKIYDAEYISYVESGESAAVFITRDIADEINTKGKWIDVIDLDTFDKQGRKAFNYFIVELFDRKIRPVYPEKADDDTKKYITWQTAHKDINEQRSRGIRGPKYIVLSHLYNKNKGTYRTIKAVWNKTFEQWVPEKWYSTSSCEYRDKKVYVPPHKDDWQYKVQAVQKVNEKQVQYIVENKYQIIERIIKNKKPELRFFYL